MARDNPHDRTIQTFHLTWEGVAIEIRYEASWLGNAARQLAHLDVTSITPARALLPITESGYRSHFLLSSGDRGPLWVPAPRRSAQ